MPAVWGPCRLLLPSEPFAAMVRVLASWYLGDAGGPVTCGEQRGTPPLWSREEKGRCVSEALWSHACVRLEPADQRVALSGLESQDWWLMCGLAHSQAGEGTRAGVPVVSASASAT